MSGDYTVGDTLYFLFTTRRFTTGAPFTLAGTPVISAYENEGLTQITAGVSLGVDHDGVTGLNLCTVVASGANGFESGKDYHLVITTGTVDSVSVVGEVVGRFTLQRSAAAVDLANGTDGLGAIKTDTAAILVDTGTTLDARIPAALVGGRMDASVGAMAANVLTATAINADAITAAKIADNAIDSATLAADVTGRIATAVWEAATATYGGAGTYGLAVEDILTDTGTDIPASLTTIDDFLDTEVAAIKAKTDNLPAAPAAVGDIPTATQNADALLNRDMSAVTVTNARSPINALRWLRNKWSNSGGTLTVYKEDDVTTAWTATTTTAASDPVDSVDPA